MVNNLERGPVNLWCTLPFIFSICRFFTILVEWGLFWWEFRVSPRLALIDDCLNSLSCSLNFGTLYLVHLLLIIPGDHFSELVTKRINQMLETFRCASLVLNLGQEIFRWDFSSGNLLFSLFVLSGLVVFFIELQLEDIFFFVRLCSPLTSYLFEVSGELTPHVKQDIVVVEKLKADF